MHAAVARAGQVELETVDDPRAGCRPRVLVEPIACGLCGSDLRLLETQAAMPDLMPAMTLGHEFVGRVLDYGPDTERRLPVGSRRHLRARTWTPPWDPSWSGCHCWRPALWLSGWCCRAAPPAGATDGPAALPPWPNRWRWGSTR